MNGYAHQHVVYCAACDDSIGVCHTPTAHLCKPKFCAECVQDPSNDITDYLSTGIYYTQAETHAALAGTLSITHEHAGVGR